MGWLFIVAVLAGTLYPLSKELAGLQDGDGILTSLISTQKLTWYFWGQDRLLNLLPALASPFRNLETNLHFQLFLRSFTAFFAPAAVLVLLLKDRRQLLFFTAVAGLLLATASRGYSLFNLYVQHNPFSTSLALFAAAVGVLLRWQGRGAVSVAVLLGAVSYGVNLALVVVTVPLLVLCIAFQQDNRRPLTNLLKVQLLSFVLAYLHARIFGESATSLGVNFSLEAIRTGWATVATHIRIGWLAVVLVLASGAAAFLRTREAGLALLVAVGMPVAITAMSCLTWLQLNSFDVRYYLIFILVFSACCAYLLFTPLVSRLSRVAQRAASIACVWFVFSFSLGGLSENPWELIAPRWRAQSQVAADIASKEEVQLVVGEFWDVWPTVFVARESLRQQGRSQAELYGGAFRGHVLRHEIAALLHRQGKIRSLCLKESLQDCIAITNEFVTRKDPVHYVAGSLKHVDIAGKSGLVYEAAGGTPGVVSDANFCLEMSPVEHDTLHQVGALEGGRLVNDGRQGFLMFGPYKAVPAGHYRLQVVGETSEARGAWVDIGSGSGSSEHGRMSLTSNARGEIATLDFELVDAVPDLEVRVWTNPSDRVSVSGYRLASKGAASTACRLDIPLLSH